jgi:lipid A ethanolaminephosphotransferase
MRRPMVGQWLTGPWTLRVESLALLASLFWAFTANRSFLASAMQGHAAADVASWKLGLALAAALLALNLLLVALVSNRWTVKPLLALLTVGTALAAFYIQRFGIYLDPSMMRNLLRTDVAEARELLSLPLLLHMLVYAGIPLLLLWRVRVLRQPWPRALAWRVATLVAAFALLVGSVLAVYQPVASLMRNHKELRYLITPANFLWSSAAVLAADARGAAQPRQAIGLDAAPGPSWAARTKPLVVVMVVGETARAANWGLSGAARDTTPELAALARNSALPGSLQNFSHVTACGTSTEVSLPCMFAPVGRRHYDEHQIRGQESVLHVAARAGVQVNWIDNQSGCKGVCEGLPSETTAGRISALCADGRCLDGELLVGLDERLKRAQGTQLWVLHMLGSHGPSYFRRYPADFARFKPECLDDDLSRCTAQEVVNAYDNSLLYTDHVLAATIARLQAHAGEVDSALLFVSDHGESLGERGLFLHGMPHAIAPDVQTQVPMVTWISPGLEASAGMKPGCLAPTLARRAAEPVAHDHLFHTLLGLLDVQTTLREEDLDLTQGCAAASGARAP